MRACDDGTSVTMVMGNGDNITVTEDGTGNAARLWIALLEWDWR